MVRMVLLVLAAFGLVLGSARACERFPQPRLPTASVTLQTASGSHAITAELARVEAERACGLMGRPPLAPNEGMLFDMRPVGPAFFWMDNTPEPLDMLFADPDGVIIHIEHNAVPFSQRMRGTRKPVAAVLELAGGTAERLDVRIGDQMSLPWITGG